MSSFMKWEYGRDLPDGVTVRVKGCPPGRGQCVSAAAAASVLTCCVSGV